MGRGDASTRACAHAFPPPLFPQWVPAETTPSPHRPPSSLLQECVLASCCCLMLLAHTRSTHPRGQSKMASSGGSKDGRMPPSLPDAALVLPNAQEAVLVALCALLLVAGAGWAVGRVMRAASRGHRRRSRSPPARARGEGGLIRWAWLGGGKRAPAIPALPQPSTPATAPRDPGTSASGQPTSAGGAPPSREAPSPGSAAKRSRKCRVCVYGERERA
jgi:hypothetical protein